LSMAIRLYDTLSQQTREVEVDDEPIKIYQCGPTVYATAHIGHARPAVVYDTLVRYLRYRGHSVTHVVNFTDVDDKIIARASEESRSPLELAEQYIEEYLETIDLLGAERADYYPRVSEHIDDIVDVVQGLVDKGHAYESGGDVYFDVSSFPDYGKLSNRQLEELIAGARVEIGEGKRDPADFALWKAAKPGEISWPSPWGPGRPGWHIECTALVLTYLGESIDIHGGGTDLVFPHHENEIAQSEAYTGKKPFAKIWMHCGLLQLAGDKMAKSEGNVISARDAIKQHGAETIRYFMLSSHYRKPLSWDQQRLENARNGWERYRNAIRNIRARLPGERHPGSTSGLTGIDTEKLPESAQKLADQVSTIVSRFNAAMEADFNTSLAIARLFELAGAANRYLETTAGRELSTDEVLLLEAALTQLATLGDVLGIYGAAGREADDTLLASLVDLLVRIRSDARAQSNWALADFIRDELDGLGVTLEDTADGTRWFWQ